MCTCVDQIPPHNTRGCVYAECLCHCVTPLDRRFMVATTCAIIDGLGLGNNGTGIRGYNFGRVGLRGSSGLLRAGAMCGAARKYFFLPSSKLV